MEFLLAVFTRPVRESGQEDFRATSTVNRGNRHGTPLKVKSLPWGEWQGEGEVSQNQYINLKS